ncbi:MAG: ATP-binding protein, partial [Asticcacaulis sp.]
PITTEGTDGWQLVTTGNPTLMTEPVNIAIVRQVAILFLLGGVSFILMSGLMYLGAIRPLRASRTRAVTENEAKSLFLANMSHEIRTPLNGVIGIAGALARTPLDARQREMVELITESGDALQRLLSDILDFSKISAGKFDLHPEPFDLRTSIEAATRLLRSRATEKGLAFNLRFSETAHGHFIGDAVRIRQIVTNLCANAIKFTESGHVRVEVTVLDPDQASDPSQITLAISDSGIGISHDMQARLFQRFEQADASVTRRFGGTGLGLSICKALAELMGGSITVSSAVGVGSCFQVVLPLHRAQGVTDPKHGEVQALSADRLGLDAVFLDDRPLRILLAEDHVTNQKLVGMILEPLKVNLTVVPGGREAVKAFTEAPADARFDLILMDMQMPDMDGLAATQQIRACEASLNLARTPIGMLSANALKEHMQLAMAAGCDLYLPKPVTPATLIDGVRRLMALRPVSSL